MGDARVVIDGLGFPESLRWHDDQTWLCNWGAGEILAVDEQGGCDVMHGVERTAFPFSIDWLPDGRLLLIDGPGRRLLRQDAPGSLTEMANLTNFSQNPFNELVVDKFGNAYVNGGDGVIILVPPDAEPFQVASGLRFPNGMTLIDGDRLLVVADSHARQLISFRVQEDGTLGDGRVWAELEDAPDGICADAERAIWVSSVPGCRCSRIAEGGQLLNTVEVDRGCFSCILGGEDGRTLFIGAAQWRGMNAAYHEGPGHSGQLLAVPHQPARRSGHP